MQKCLAINHADDWRVERFQSTLDDLYCIQLDSSFIDAECNRVNRDSLAALLTELTKTDASTTIFLDYDFEPLDTTENKILLGKDSLLYESMLTLGNRLILVSNSDGKTIFSDNTWTTSTYENRRIPIAPVNGGIELVMLPKEKTIRYFNVQLQNTEEPSFIELLYRKATGKQLNHSLGEIELNYLIEDNRPKGRRPLLHGATASTIVQGGLDKSKFGQAKIIVIGAFHELFNKYNLSFDSFETPIANPLSGIYININAYLNVVTQSYIKRSPAWLVFILNFLLALGGSVYYYFVQKKRQKNFVKPPSWIKGELVFSFLFFTSFIIGLFYYYYLKFPFVPTLLFFVGNQRLYKFFLSFTKKQ